MSILVKPPYPSFFGVDGIPLSGGYIYIGQEGLDPISNPKAAYWDFGLTIPALNVRTTYGYPSREGTPARLFVDGRYSIIVKDKNGVVVYFELSVIESVAEADHSALSDLAAHATRSDLGGLYADVQPTHIDDVVLGISHVGLRWMTSAGQEFVWNGSTWSFAQGYKTEVRLTSGSGNWAVPVGVFKIRVKCIGGGGGGSQSQRPYTVNNYQGGGGGGGTHIGSVPWSYINTVPGSNIAYSVGAGGAGGISGGAAATAGGTTTFTGATSGSGGGAALGMQAGTPASGGYGAAGSAGNGSDATNYLIDGEGGSGGGCGGGALTAAGFGGGGYGGPARTGQAPINGGAGGSGLIIIEY